MVRVFGCRLKCRQCGSFSQLTSVSRFAFRSHLRIARWQIHVKLEFSSGQKRAKILRKKPQAKQSLWRVFWGRPNPLRVLWFATNERLFCVTPRTPLPPFAWWMLGVSCLGHWQNKEKHQPLFRRPSLRERLKGKNMHKFDYGQKCIRFEEATDGSLSLTSC